MQKITDLAYFAGLFDGEGSLCGRYDVKRPKRKDKKIDIHMKIDITCEEAIRKVSKMVGIGSIYSFKYTKQNPRQQKIWRINFSPNEMRIILPKILPFLIVKKKQAEIMLKLLALRKQSKAYHSTHKQQIKLIDMLHRLNGAQKERNLAISLGWAKREVFDAGFKDESS